jgi:hypothetical protein
MSPLAPPLDITSRLVRLLFSHWEQKRGTRFAPSWRDIDPGDIRPSLPYLSSADVLADPFDLRYRLVGSAVVNAAGYDFTGQTLRAMRVATGFDVWLAHYRAVVDGKVPRFGMYRAHDGGELRYKVDHVCLPLSQDGLRVDRIMEIEDWSMIRDVSPTRMQMLVWRFDPL